MSYAHVPGKRKGPPLARCRCGCGAPTIENSYYATPRCRERFSRRDQRKLLGAARELVKTGVLGWNGERLEVRLTLAVDGGGNVRMVRR